MRKNLGLECASCGSSQNVRVVCHHCGRPLCNNHNKRCQIELEDDVFSGNNAIIAIHCHQCWEKHHPNVKLRTVAGRLK